jgi:putative DNA primase/helicase
MNTSEVNNKTIDTDSVQVVLSDSLNVSTEEFLKLFGDVRCFRTFSDAGKDGYGRNFNDSYESIRRQLKKENEGKRGVFFIPNEGGHSDDDITRIQAVFMDLDEVPIQPVLDAIALSGLTPHAIIKSSFGEHHHIYWLVNNFLVERFRTVQRGFIKPFGHDDKVINPSRVMRLPGYFHHKSEPFLSRVVYFNSGLPRYSEQDVIDGLGLTLETEPTNRNNRPNVAIDRSRPVADGERNATLISYAGELERKNLSYDDIWTKLSLANSRYNPPETDQVIRKKVDSIWKYRMIRVENLEDLLEKLKAATQSQRIKMIQDDEAKDALRLCEATEPDKWVEIKNLFKGYVKELKSATKTHPIPTLATPSAKQIIDEISGCPKTYPGDFEGFPTVDRYFFQQTGKGVSLFYYVKEDRQDEVCHTPVFITKRFIRDNQEVFLEVAWLEKDRWNYLRAPRGDFFNTRRIVDLADRNFPVGSANAKALARYLQAFEATYIERLPEQKISFRMGWHGKSFLVGDECISSDGTTIEFQSADGGDCSIVEGIKTKGQYEKWLEAVNKVSSYHLPMIALYAALSTPLIKILDVSSFGLDYSGRTSTGKTTNLRIGASAWGQPDEGSGPSMTRTWDSTNVSVERTCELLSDLPIILDDTKRAKPGAVGSKLYLVTSGQGRGRGSKTGLRETQSWRTVLISSGEASAVTYTKDAGARARILTLRGLPFGTEPNRDLVNELNLSIKNHYGHAGRLWVKWLIDNHERWGSFKKRLDELSRKLDPSNGAEARLAEKAAVIELTGELVHEALNLPWEYSDPIRKVWSKIKQEAQELDIHIRGARSIYEWAVAHPTSFWGQHKEDNDENPIEPHNGWAGRWKIEYATGHDVWPHIYFIPRQLEEICKKADFDYGAVMQGLIDSKLGSPKHFVTVHKKRVKCFKILRSALTGEDDTEITDYPREWDDD